MDMKNVFSTKDLPESAFLYASGKKLIGLEKDGEKVWFIFEDKLSCQGLIDCYWRKEALIDAKTFSDSLRSLKDLIFNR